MPSLIRPRLFSNITKTTTARLIKHVPQPNNNISIYVCSRLQTRTMASSSPAPLQEWLVIAPDHQSALEKRLSVRPQHLEGLKKDDESFWLWGGATLAEPLADGVPPKMTGSAMLIGAKTKEEVIDRLKKDVYVTGKVWDWEKVQIIPFKSALRKAL